MTGLASFDVSTGADLQEVDNAVNQATKEVAQRYDFKGSKASIAFDRATATLDRKSTRLNSSHGYISYAVFCLKKKKKTTNTVHVTKSKAPSAQEETQNNTRQAKLQAQDTITEHHADTSNCSANDAVIPITHNR